MKRDDYTKKNFTMIPKSFRILTDEDAANNPYKGISASGLRDLFNIASRLTVTKGPNKTASGTIKMDSLLKDLPKEQRALEVSIGKLLAQGAITSYYKISDQATAHYEILKWDLSSFIKVPDFIIRLRVPSQPHAYLLLVLLVLLEGADTKNCPPGLAWRPTAKMANDLNCNKDTITESIKTLLDFELIKIVGQTIYRTNIYQVQYETAKELYKKQVSPSKESRSQRFETVLKNAASVQRIRSPLATNPESACNESGVSNTTNPESTCNESGTKKEPIKKKQEKEESELKNPNPREAGRGDFIFNQEQEQPLSWLAENIKLVMEQAERTVPGMIPSKKDLSEKLALMLVDLLEQDGDVSLAPKELIALAKSKIKEARTPCWSAIICWGSFKEDLSALVRFAKNRVQQKLKKDQDALVDLPDVIERLKKQVRAESGVHQEELLAELNGNESALVKVKARLGLPADGLPLSSLESLGIQSAPKSTEVSKDHEIEQLLAELN